MQLLAGAYPNTYGNLGQAGFAAALNQANTIQGAKNFEAGSAGLKDASEAGFQANLSSMPWFQGVTGTSGTPLPLAVAQTDANAKITAEAIHAQADRDIAAGSHNKGVIPVINPDGSGYTVDTNSIAGPNPPPTSGGSGAPMLSPTGLPPGVPGGPGSPGRTNLPPAPNKAPPVDPKQQSIQRMLAQNAAKLPQFYGQQGAADIVAGAKKNNGAPIVVP